MREFDNHIKETAKERILALENHLNADVVLFHGPIFPSVEKRFREFIEDLQAENSKTGRPTGRTRESWANRSPTWRNSAGGGNRHDYQFFLHSRCYF